jgi:hypothetical protein
MERLRLPRGVLTDAEDFRASVTCRTTPMGVELALLQHAAGDRRAQPRKPTAIWLTLLLDGEAELDDGTAPPLRPGDIAYGPTGGPRCAFPAPSACCSSPFRAWP